MWKGCLRLVHPFPSSSLRYKGCLGSGVLGGPSWPQERWSWWVEATHSSVGVSGDSILATDVSEVSSSHSAPPGPWPSVTQWNQRKRFITSHQRGGGKAR